MLGGRTVKQMYELHAKGHSVRAIARTLGLSRNSVRKYLRADEIPKPKERPRRGSKMDPFVAHLERRLAAGVQNCVVLRRELRALGYTGSSIRCSVFSPRLNPMRYLAPVGRCIWSMPSGRAAPILRSDP